LTFGTTNQREEIIAEIISKDDLINDSLLAMVKDKYGNYVVQKMIEVADDMTKDNIVKRILTSNSLKKRDGFCNKFLYNLKIFYTSNLYSVYFNFLAKHVLNFIEKLGFSSSLSPANLPSMNNPNNLNNYSNMNNYSNINNYNNNYNIALNNNNNYNNPWK